MADLGQLGIGIVGPGAIGDVHATSLASLGAPARAVAGQTAAETDGFADKHRIPRRYASLDDLLGDDDIDAVIVATPSHLHQVQSLQALESGRHVLSEIPVGLSLVEAESVADRARHAGRIAMAGHTLRYWQPHRRLQDLLADRNVTPTQVIVRSLMLRQANVGWTGRQRDWTDSVLWHHGGHAVDAALWHLRDPGPIEVSGGCGPVWSGSSRPMDVAATLRTVDGRLGSVTLSYHSRIDVTDFLIISPDHTFLVTEGRLLMDGEVVSDAGGTEAAQSSAVAAQDRDFLTAIATGNRPEVTVADVLPAMRVLQSLADSA